jgi:PIN domain nuclease of toxin-antitoxin system
MRILLDTHAFLWAGIEPHKLSSSARSLFADTANQLFLSVASLWEIAIKVNLGRLTLTRPFDEFVQDATTAVGISIIPIEVQHVSRLEKLEHHHRDPFDRMLVVQALTEQLTILSADEALDRYGVQRLW